MRLSLTLIALALTIGLIAQNQSKPQFLDKSGRYAMWFKEYEFEFPDKETIQFDVSGTPVDGRSQAQNLQFTAGRVTGTLKKTKSGDYFLTNGTASGNAVITVADKEGTSVLKSAKITLTDNGETAKASLPGPFTVTNNLTSDESGKRSLSMQGSSGTFVLKSLVTKDTNPLVTADVSGPITVTVDQVDKKGRKTIAKVTGARVSMRADGDDKIMTVSGGVKIVTDVTDPDKPGFAGEMEVQTATITFDKNYDIKKVSTGGGPGTATVREKKDGQ